jgi:hypothetical protein
MERSVIQDQSLRDYAALHPGYEPANPTGEPSTVVAALRRNLG